MELVCSRLSPIASDAKRFGSPGRVNTELYYEIRAIVSFRYSSNDKLSGMQNTIRLEEAYSTCLF